MLDIFLLLLLLMCVVRGYRAGFFMGIKKIASIILGFLIAGHFTQVFAQFLIHNSHLQATISQWLTDKLPAFSLENGISVNLPASLQEQMLHLMPLQSNDVLFSTENLVEWLTNLLIACIAFALLLVLVMVVVRLAVNTLSSLTDLLPPAYLLNHVAGAVFYGLQMMLVVMALLYVLHPLLMTSAYMDLPLVYTLQQSAEDSVILSLLKNMMHTWGWM